MDASGPSALASSTGRRRAGDLRDRLYAWYVVSVLLIAYSLAFLDRQLLSLLVQPIKRDLHLSDTALSLLHGLAFAVFMALGSVPLGRQIDRGSRTFLIAVGTAVWSCMTAACGLAQSYVALLLCRMGVGAGESVLTPAAYSVVSDYFPSHKRGLALSVYTIGVYLGSGVATLLGATVIGKLGEADIDVALLGRVHPWQLVFMAVGVPGLLIALWAATLREPPRDEGGSRPPLSVAWAYLRTHSRTLLSLVLCQAFAAMMNYSLTAWGPTLLIRRYSLPAVEAGRAFGLLILTTGTIGVVGGGWLSDRLVARGRVNGRLWVMTLASLAAIPFAFLAGSAATATSALTLLAPAMILVTMTIGTGPGALQQLVPNRLRGFTTAIAVLIVNLIGLGLGPTSIALLTDYVLGDEGRIGESLAFGLPVMLAISAVAGSLGLRAYTRSGVRPDAG